MHILVETEVPGQQLQNSRQKTARGRHVSLGCPVLWQFSGEFGPIINSGHFDLMKNSLIFFFFCFAHENGDFQNA